MKLEYTYLDLKDCERSSEQRIFKVFSPTCKHSINNRNCIGSDEPCMHPNTEDNLCTIEHCPLLK